MSISCDKDLNHLQVFNIGIKKKVHRITCETFNMSNKCCPTKKKKVYDIATKIHKFSSRSSNVKM